MSNEILAMIDTDIAAARSDLAKLPTLRGQIDDASYELRMPQEVNLPRRVAELQERLVLLETDFARMEASATARLAQA